MTLKWVLCNILKGPKDNTKVPDPGGSNQQSLVSSRIELTPRKERCNWKHQQTREYKITITIQALSASWGRSQLWRWPRLTRTFSKITRWLPKIFKDFPPTGALYYSSADHWQADDFNARANDSWLQPGEQDDEIPPPRRHWARGVRPRSTLLSNMTYLIYCAKAFEVNSRATLVPKISFVGYFMRTYMNYVLIFSIFRVCIWRLCLIKCCAWLNPFPSCFVHIVNATSLTLVLVRLEELDQLIGLNIFHCIFDY